MFTTDAAAVTIALLAAALQGFFGFGYALFSVPLLAWAFGDVKHAVIFSTITVVFHELVMLVWAFKRAPWVETLWLVVGIGGGVGLGLLVFESVDSKLLMLLLGLLLVVMGVWKLTGWTPGPEDDAMGFKAHWATLAGAATGFCGTLSCVTGPTLIVYAGLRGWSPRFIKAFLQPLFMVAIVFRLVGFAMRGVVSWPLLKLGLIAGVPTLLVTWLGLRLAHRVPRRAFDRGFYILVCVLGIITFAKAFIDWKGSPNGTQVRRNQRGHANPVDAGR